MKLCVCHGWVVELEVDRLMALAEVYVAENEALYKYRNQLRSAAGKWQDGSCDEVVTSFAGGNVPTQARTATGRSASASGTCKEEEHLVKAAPSSKAPKVDCIGTA
jgi:hypothetical protein